jgi:Tol biopolymer transport system component
MNVDGSGQTNLTNDSGDDVLPAWSPDGAGIAFTRFGDAGSEIFVMNADGSGQHSLTNTPAMYEIGCSWSPDGAQIAFNVYVPGTREGEIYVMDTGGTNRRNVSNDPRDDESPAWSPDGQHIAFTRTTDGNADIWLMNADGSRQKDITADPTAGETAPAWSPDGARIAFTHFVGSPANSDVYVMNAAGGAPRRLTSSDGYDMRPTWSPDGKRIAFATERYSIVPSVQGLTLRPAVRRIRSRGLRVGRVRRVRSTRIGKVIAQRPRAGRRVRRLAKVALVVGRP